MPEALYLTPIALPVTPEALILTPIALVVTPEAPSATPKALPVAPEAPPVAPKAPPVAPEDLPDATEALPVATEALPDATKTPIGMAILAGEEGFAGKVLPTGLDFQRFGHWHGVGSSGSIACALFSGELFSMASGACLRAESVQR